MQNKLCLWKLLEYLRFCASLLFFALLFEYYTYSFLINKAEVSKSSEEKKEKQLGKNYQRQKNNGYIKTAFYNTFLSLFQNSLFKIVIVMFYNVSDGV